MPDDEKHDPDRKPIPPERSLKRRRDPYEPSPPGGRQPREPWRENRQLSVDRLTENVYWVMWAALAVVLVLWILTNLPVDTGNPSESGFRQSDYDRR